MTELQDKLARLDRLYSSDPAIRASAWRDEPPEEFMTRKQLADMSLGYPPDLRLRPNVTLYDRIAIAPRSDVGLNQ